MLTKQTAVVLGLIAGAFLVLGVIVGVTPVRSDGFACGTAFAESDHLLTEEYADTLTGGTGESGCDDARGSRQLLTWAPIGLGAFLGVGTFMLAQVPGNAKKPAHPEG